MGGRKSKTAKELLKSLSAGLSEKEIERVLAGALSTLGAKGIERLAGRLGPDTGAALRRTLRARGKKRPPVPGPSKILQEWERAWKDWDGRISEAVYEEGDYIVKDNDWEEPYLDFYSLTNDLEPIAARMSELLPRVFDEDLDPDFDFAEAVAECVDEIGSGLPDWMCPFDQGDFELGPKATKCFIEWEWRSAQRDGKSTFDLIDKLRSLEASHEGLDLDDKAVASFVRSLGREAKGDILEGIRRNREEDRWKKVLESAHSGWFRLYQDLCRGQDRSAYLESCRDRISDDWSLALPVVKNLAGKKAHEDVCRVCADAVSSFLDLREGGKWDPRSTMLAPVEDDYREKNTVDRLKTILKAWREAARAMGRDETDAALRLQSALLDGWPNWDKALGAFGRIPSPRFDAMRDRLFSQWRSLVAKRSLDRHDYDEDRSVLWKKPREESTWVHALADAARLGEGGSDGFLKEVRLRLKKAEESGDSLRDALNVLARLSLDLDPGGWLRRISPSLESILARGWTRAAASSRGSRRSWLERLGATALIPELEAFWKRNMLRLVPDPASNDYDRCVDWLRALRDVDHAAGEELLRRWADMHWRRKNLWRAAQAKGLPVPERKKPR
ncbi:MAG: hypothetical protein ABII00_01770 [Elusimicrobiota bacterium]